MRLLRNVLDSGRKHFEDGGKLSRLYPLYEMIDTFLYTPADTTSGRVHVRDALDLKRLMSTVGLALAPCIVMAMVNTGREANRALYSMGLQEVGGWRGEMLACLSLPLDPTHWISNAVHGALWFLPVLLVTQIVGGMWEALFAIVRRHEINEGFLVTGLLFPLTLPPTIPLWQVALGISFGVVIGKEIFGGTGKNFLNPALTARAFLFFAYPAQISGDAVWVAVDGYTGATALAQAAAGGAEAVTASWSEAFWGFIPGSMGETSTAACLLGALYLIFTGIGSWRIMLSMLLSTLAGATVLYTLESSTNPMFQMHPVWHLLVGGFAFGLVFMATDPVSATMTQAGQYFYGALIGFMVILVRVINPAFPEGTMLAILFGNCFAPLIDWFVVNSHIKRRQKRLINAKG